MGPEEDRKIRSHMKSIVSEHVDPKTGEVNMTELAEDTCDDLNLYEADGYTIPEDMFELAFEVADDYEKEHAR